MNEAQKRRPLPLLILTERPPPRRFDLRQRGTMIRHLAGRTHAGPDGSGCTLAHDRPLGAGVPGRGVRCSRPVVPHLRAGHRQDLLELAEALKLEVPRRTAAQVAEIIRTAKGSGPSERTLQRHFARLGLNTRPDGPPPQAFSRFEARAPATCGPATRCTAR